MSRYDQPLAVAVAAAQAAGQLLRQEFHRPGGPRGSGEHADADIEAERLIREQLLAAFPWRYLGEETGRGDSTDPHIWLVDPNDGTAAYLQGFRGSAVSLAALRDGVPVLGVVYAYTYPDDRGDLIVWAEGCGPISRNGQPVTNDLTTAVLDRQAIVFVSQSADKNSAANSRCVAPGRFIAVPSIAYRLALVAAGEGVAAVSLSKPGAWDYAAGQALLRGVGGVLVDERGKEVRYNSDGTSQTKYCFGGARRAVAELVRRAWPQTLVHPPVATSGLFALTRLVPGQTVSKPELLSRAQGCLLGQFAGDSLGSLVEFSGPDTIRARYPSGVRNLADGGTYNTLAGQPTDDSEMALMLSRALIREGHYEPGQVLNAYVHWLVSRPFDIGFTTSAALGAALGAPATDPDARLLRAAARAVPHSEANGSLMRASPLGIFGVGQPSRASDWARADSRLTHPNPVCQEACAAFIVALIRAIGEGGDAEACYQAALTEAAKPGGQASVHDALVKARLDPPDDYLSQQGWVLIALQNAFYQLLHARDLEEGVVATVMAGGDTDTNGAIAGALLGAVHGREAIPARWRRAVLSCRPLTETQAKQARPVEFWPVDALELAEALLWAGSQDW